MPYVAQASKHAHKLFEVLPNRQQYLSKSNCCEGSSYIKNSTGQNFSRKVSILILSFGLQLARLILGGFVDISESL